MLCLAGKFVCDILQAWSRFCGVLKVRDAGCDVLMLQEVRIQDDRSWSQASFLQHLMPQFRWTVTRWANAASRPSGSFWTDWEGEGLAVLSKLPTGTVWVEHLSRVHGPDTNQRIALHVPIIIDSGITINIIVAHFSYHRQQQCQNAAEILKFIHRNDLRNTVVGGDFNIYPDFAAPVRLFLDRNNDIGRQINECSSSILSLQKTALHSFQDAWEAANKDLPGFTFSNMPRPGLISRPDRILISSNIRVKKTSLHGNGTAYKFTYSTEIFMYRLRRIIHAAKDAFEGSTGYSCLQDCGPHGSCRCGVCVKKEDFDTCHLPDCEECTSEVFIYICVFLALLFLLFLLAGVTTVKILVIASHMDQAGTFFLLGCTCCLCHPRLTRRSTMTARHCTGRLLRCLGIGKIPPAFLLLLSVTLITFCLIVGSWFFRSSLSIAASVMLEEYYPSDHLMIAAHLQITA